MKKGLKTINLIITFTIVIFTQVRYMVTIKGNKSISIISKNSRRKKNMKTEHTNTITFEHYRLIAICCVKHLAQYNKFSALRAIFSLRFEPLAEYSFTSVLNGIESNRLNLTQSMIAKYFGFAFLRSPHKTAPFNHDVCGCGQSYAVLFIIQTIDNQDQDHLKLVLGSRTGKCSRFLLSNCSRS